MKVKGDFADVFRISVSSGPSTSSHGSAQDYSEAYGDVYLWGEVLFDSSRTNNDINISLYSGRHDLLLPKPLESNVLLDIQHVSCGVKHAALVTKQGEVFTWGKGSYGLLGYGVEAEAIQPRLVESLSDSDIEFVACGEFHTCAVSTSGELYTWGDGAHKAGLLGHGTNISHWIPRRVSGPLEGLQVSSVSCGTWHSALITSAGKLFTFGDGTFGTLGHGNRESAFYPREVESLIGLRAIAVSCGVWHTAAVVEVIVTQSSASSGKLFTWGDGDKYRLGHGDKDSRLKPTCVPSLIDYIFCNVACGHSLTIGLTTSGDIFTMGSTVYGQLGNPLSDGKLPCLVQDKLANEHVVEVACGSYHVTVLTSKNEVYTWGKGANGRLGHGDLEDRKTPTIVEALKDRPVKHIACGENFTSALCQHKWVSSADQSQCTACRQAFGFTRKRHNCYNCGLVHCHSCSSRKFVRAALAPIPGKPYRVCDSCYAKLHRVIESAKMNDKKSSLPHFRGDKKDHSNKANFKKPKAVSPNKRKAAKQGKKSDALSSIRPQQIAPLSQPRDVTFSVGIDVQRANPRLTLLSAIQSPNNSEAGSPFSEKPRPPYFATGITTMSECSFSESIDERLKKSNDLLNQEVQRLRGQVDSLRQRCETQEYELKKSATKVREAMAFAAEESEKSRSAKEVIKSLTQQLKDMAERLPQNVYETDSAKHGCIPNANGLSQDVYETDRTKPRCIPNGNDSNSLHCVDFLAACNSTIDANNWPQIHSTVQNPAQRGITEAAATIRTSKVSRSNPAADLNGLGPEMNSEHITNGKTDLGTCRYDCFHVKDDLVEAEWIEQYEPGVYITLIALVDGSRYLKRVRFSRRRFTEQQAEAWLSEHRSKVYDRYNVRGLYTSSSTLSTQYTG